MTRGGGHWVLLDCLEFSKNLFISLRADDPLEMILRRIFAEVLGKLLFYSGATHGLHLLGNAIDFYQFEMDHLYVDPTMRHYFDQALLARRRPPALPGNDASTQLRQPPPYLRTTATDHTGMGLRTELGDLLHACRPYLPVLQPRSGWGRILNNLNDGRRKAGVTNLCPAIQCTAKDILVIMLAERTEKLPASKLGTIVLWSEGEAATESMEKLISDRVESLVVASKALGQFVGQLLESHYGVTEETYLPSFKKPGPRSVAIMFADVRDFTPATEIARNFNLLEEFTEFIARYCREMCEIIQAHGGRVHSLAGDGIMALFGEYAAESDAVRSAVEAARRMCAQFEKIKSEYLERPKIREFLAHEYEPMNFRLGIGINFGSVIFDYFGAPGSRVYSPFGDHVNFAQRLETEAARFDERLRERPDRMRAPILLSRPAWLKAGLGETREAVLALTVKGKPYSYPAYEVWPEP
jgi:class 3 adenylate cyclase